jgi:TM2 domain-containing membrane protein YozV
VVEKIPACPDCGQTVQEGDTFCEHCGAHLEPQRPVVQPPPPPPPPFTAQPGTRPGTEPGEKNPILAAVASLLFVGLGQVYNGQFAKGLLIFFGAILGSILVVPGILVWLFGIFDAYRTSQKMNSGAVPFREYSWGGIIGFILIGFFAVAIYTAVLEIASEMLYYYYLDMGSCDGFYCE